MFAALGLALFGLGATPQASFAQGLPPGSYTQTCNNVQMVANVLEASCQRADGSWANAALPNPGGCGYGVTNSNGALVCAGAPAVGATTSEYDSGVANLNNTCSNGQQAFFAIATNNKETSGLAVILKPGQTVEVAVTKGSSYEAACGAFPSDQTHFQYFNIKTSP